MASEDLLQRRLEREKRARLEAESILETKAAELYRANEEIRASAETLEATASKLTAIMDAVAQAIFTIDDDGHIQTQNHGAQMLFGYSGEEVTGKSLWELLPNLASDKERAAQRSFLSGENLEQLDRMPAEYGLRLDGGTFPAEFSITDTQVQDERIIIVVVRDISRRIEREKDQQALEAQLSQAQKLEAIGTLAGGIAHEINTPIQYIGDNLRFLGESHDDLAGLLDQVKSLVSTVRGHAVLAAQAEALDKTIEEVDLDYVLEEVPSAIKQSIGGVEQVASIVLAMKEFSHPGTKEKVPTDLNRTIENALTVSRSEWKHVADLTLELDQTLEQVPCLPAELNQVFLNLIVNAAHAIEAARDGDSALGRLSISTVKQGPWVEIRVADSGTGVPVDLRERIFEPFFTTKGVGKGTGQGLAITHDIVVNKHGGEIELESELGQGTTFRVRLPLTEDGGSEELVA